MTTPPPGIEPLPIELTVSADVRAVGLSTTTRIPVRFTYDPAVPYALRMDVYDPSQSAWEPWTASREVFMAAAMWDLALPGLDLVVIPVVVTRGPSGRAAREVPCIRVTIYETDPTTGRHTGNRMCLDIEVADLRPYLNRLARVVPVGLEHRHLNLDETIDRLLGRTADETGESRG